jgi:hypothetical protein
MRSLRIVLSALAGALVLAGPAQAAPAWAPASSATIHPGVNTTTGGASCTSNFIFYDASNVYVGQAAHCSGTGAATDTNGCDSGSLPIGTPVEVDGASQPGTLVYNSWLTMQSLGETNASACQYNDFALVRLDPADVGKVNPSVPDFGGPTGLRSGAGMTTGTKVLSYGNSILRQGITLLSPKYGYQVQATSDEGWNHTIYTVTPGIPGDSGSGFFDGSGKAFGVLSTVAIAPLPASNGVGDLAKELAYAQTSGGFAGVQLANGTEPFTGGLIPLP